MPIEKLRGAYRLARSSYGSNYERQKMICPVKRPVPGSYKTTTAYLHSSQVAYEDCLLDWAGAEDLTTLTHSWMSDLVSIAPNAPTVLYQETTVSVRLALFTLAKRCIYAWPLAVVVGSSGESLLYPAVPIERLSRIIVTKVLGSDIGGGRENRVDPRSWCFHAVL